MSNTLTSKVSGRMSSRGWAIALGIGAVVLAAILLVVYLDRYRARVGGENAPTPCPGREAAHSGRHARLARREPVDVRADDASAEGGRGRSDLRSRRTSADARRPQRSSPGQQLTATDFAASDTASVDSQITGTQRAISISIDGVHGSSSQIMPGDSVDVYLAVAGTVKLFEPNVKVLDHADAFPGPAGGGNLILRIETGRGREVGLRERQRVSSGSSFARSSVRSRPSRQPRTRLRF